MRKISLFILFSLFSLSSFAQFTISGKVLYKENNQPVIGATVYLPDLKTGTSTDVNGNYQISDLKSGTFTIQISYISHKNILEKVQISGNLSKDFFMENSTLNLDEVIVSGASVKTIIKESPIPIATLSRTQWLQSSSTNLVDAVAKLPGMSQISTGVGISKPVIRGLGFNRVITMHDGIRQEDNQWGEEHSIHIDEYSIDRYEIIRGAGSLMYGSDGLGGVMSVLSPMPVEDGKTIGSILYNYQTNNQMHGLSGMVAGTKNGFNYLFRTSMKNAGNYRNTFDEKVFGSNFRELINLNGMLGLTKKWGYSRVYFARWNQQINIIDGARDNAGKFTKSIAVGNQEEKAVVSDEELRRREINLANSQDLTNIKVSSNNLFFIKQASLSANIGYSQNHRREYANVFNTQTPALYFYLQTLYYDLRYNFAERNGWETTIGSNGMYQLLQNKGTEVLYPDFDLNDKGIFIFSKKSFAKLKMSGGLRYDLRNLTINKLYIDANGKFQTSPDGAVAERFAGFSRNFGNVTGSFGAVYEFSKQLQIKANVARGFRSPGVPEISSNGEHAGTFRYEIGNINQQSEVSLQTDLGITFEDKNWYADLTIFNNRINNYTYSERVQTPVGNDSLVAGVPVFRYTQGNARLQGVEATLTFSPENTRWLNLTQTYSMVVGSNLSATESQAQNLPFMPPPRWISRIRLSKENLGKFLSNAYVLAEFEYHQAQNRVLLAYNTETTTPDYGLLNAGFGADVVNKNHKTLFSVYVSGQNLTNLAYQNHQNRLKYLEVNAVTGRQGVFNMGRNVSLKLLFPLAP
ncbi:MAG: TonB-dependent receptor [Verrucomicrobia bacterium]|nr:TonB-dependent receptor [Cytophagales bacterium]